MVVEQKLFSIVIPSKERPKVLKKTLSAIYKAAPKSFLGQVVLVIEDVGGESLEVAEEFKRNSPYGIDVVIITAESLLKPGIGYAKMMGILSVTMPWTIVMADDVYLNSRALSKMGEHILNEKSPVASYVGFLEWERKEQDVSPFMEWLMDGGASANYIAFEKDQELNPEQYYGWLVCSPTHVLKENTYDENFIFPSYDDWELGYRLNAIHPGCIRYFPDLRGTHTHPVSIYSWLPRHIKTVKQCIYFYKKHQDDLNLHEKLQILRAKEIDTFDIHAVSSAVHNVIKLSQALDYEILPLVTKSIFGQVYRKNVLWESYRMLNQFFFLSHLRTELGLSPMRSLCKNPVSAEVIRNKVIDCLSKNMCLEDAI